MESKLWGHMSQCDQWGPGRWYLWWWLRSSSGIWWASWRCRSSLVPGVPPSRSWWESWWTGAPTLKHTDTGFSSSCWFPWIMHANDKDPILPITLMRSLMVGLPWMDDAPAPVGGLSHTWGCSRFGAEQQVHSVFTWSLTSGNFDRGHLRRLWQKPKTEAYVSKHGRSHLGGRSHLEPECVEHWGVRLCTRIGHLYK